MSRGKAANRLRCLPFRQPNSAVVTAR